MGSVEQAGVKAGRRAVPSALIPQLTMRPLKSALSDPKLALAWARFVAWWEGEPFDEAAAARAAAARRQASEGAAERRHDETWRAPLQDLAAHARVAQWLWGEGHLAPFPDDLQIEFAKALLLNAEKSLAVIGPGLGAGARAIARETGVWIDGYEPRADIAAAGAEQCVAAGMGKKVQISHWDADAPDLPHNKFHAVLCVGELMFVQDKTAVLAAIKGGLKKNGAFLWADYVAGEGGAADMAQASFSPCWGAPHLQTAAACAEMMGAQGFDVRVREDVTSAHLDDIAEGWGRWRTVAAAIEQADLSEDERAGLMRVFHEAAQMWAARREALSQGALKVFRFLAM